MARLAEAHAARGALRMAPAVLLALWLTAGIAGLPGLTGGGVVRADGGAPNLAYIVGGGRGGDLVVVDVAQRRVSAHIPLGGNPQAVVLSLDSRFAYVTQAARDRVAVVDAQAKRVSGSIPTGHAPGALALDTMVSGDLYVVNAGGNSVTAIDLIKQRAIAAVPVGKHPAGIAIANPSSGISEGDDAEIYVTNSDDNTVSIISAKQRRVMATIPVPGGPLGVVVPAVGGVAYVGTRSGAILALGLASHRLLGTLRQLQGSASGAMDYDQVTGQIYVPDAAAGVVEVLRPVSAGENGAAPSLPPEPARTLHLGGGPAAVAITFDGAYGFVAQQEAGHATMLDIATYQTLATLDVGGSPRAIITGAYPPALNRQAANIVGILSYVFVGLVLLSIAGFYLGWFRALRRRLSDLRARKSGQAGGIHP